MNFLSFSDVSAVIVFLLSWIIYGISLERAGHNRISLNRMMNVRRHGWADQLGIRENRVVDVLINISLQNGTAFFASAALIALGGILSFSYTPDDGLATFSGLILEKSFDRTVWSVKIAGLALIFIYAFFKFSWSYRLFYYVSILIGAVPDRAGDPQVIKLAVRRVALMNVEAGRHFNRGLQAFFFALAYLGWFVGPYMLMATTIAVLVVVWRRQFQSDAHEVLAETENDKSLIGKSNL